MKKEFVINVSEEKGFKWKKKTENHYEINESIYQRFEEKYNIVKLNQD